jgi:hypothetical protein
MPYRIDKKNGVYLLWNLVKKKHVAIPYKSRKTAMSAGKNFMAYSDKTNRRNLAGAKYKT